MVGAEFIHRDLIVLGIADEPFVRVEAIIVGAQPLDDFVDIAAVLDGHGVRERRPGCLAY